MVMIAGAARGEDLPVYGFLEAGSHIGERAVVTGKVVGTYNSGKACYLNFHDDWKKHFSVVIFAKNFDRFEAPPEVHYRDAEVRVTGRIQEYEGRPEIIVTGPAEIEIVAGGGTAPAEIRWSEAGANIGKKVVVEGTIVRTHNTGKLAFLNFDQDVDNTLTVVIFDRFFDRFPESPEKHFLNRTVRVTGELKEYKGKPEIIVGDPAQIAIVDGAEEPERPASASAEAMIRALVDLLVRKGVLTEEEFQESLAKGRP